MKNYLSKNHNQKVSTISKKHYKYSYTIAIDLPWILPKISDMSKIRILIYTLDKYSLQTRIVSFPDQEKLVKEVHSG